MDGFSGVVQNHISMRKLKVFDTEDHISVRKIKVFLITPICRPLMPDRLFWEAVMDGFSGVVQNHISVRNLKVSDTENHTPVRKIKVFLHICYLAQRDIKG